MTNNKSGAPPANGTPNPENMGLNQNSYSNSSAKLGFRKPPFSGEAGPISWQAKLQWRGLR